MGILKESKHCRELVMGLLNKIKKQIGKPICQTIRTGHDFMDDSMHTVSTAAGDLIFNELRQWHEGFLAAKGLLDGGMHTGVHGAINASHIPGKMKRAMVRLMHPCHSDSSWTSSSSEGSSYYY